MCGLKSVLKGTQELNIKVTPHVGVWIEILFGTNFEQIEKVTPHVGVWIEIFN